MKNGLRFLLVAVLAGMLGGCFTIGDRKEENSLGANFGGDPNLSGIYSAAGKEQSWDWAKQSVTTDSTNMGSLFISSRHPQPYLCDTVRLSTDRRTALNVVFLKDGKVTDSLRFDHHAHFTETPRWISITISRDGEQVDISKRVVLQIARDANGQLDVFERDTTLSVTGLGIPIVPYHYKEAFRFHFPPANTTRPKN